jgi:hypothetical protein
MKKISTRKEITHVVSVEDDELRWLICLADNARLNYLDTPDDILDNFEIGLLIAAMRRIRSVT